MKKIKTYSNRTRKIIERKERSDVHRDKRVCIMYMILEKKKKKEERLKWQNQVKVLLLFPILVVVDSTLAFIHIIDRLKK